MQTMKASITRLRRLEDRFGPAVETESSQRLHKGIKAGRRRVAEMCESPGLPPLADLRPFDRDDRHLPMIERIKARLNSGHDRVVLANQSSIQAFRASDATAPVSTRVRAADSVPDHSAKAIEIKISKRPCPRWRRPWP
jgi:hypothetical protein